MTLDAHVRTLGRGPGRSRSLTRDEAEDAMRRMLGGADPHAVGALLMLMRMKGETADEIAGFAAAAQATLPLVPRADLDWPAYAAGRTRGLPWFLIAAQRVAAHGHRVVLHGAPSGDGSVRAGCAALGIAIAPTPDAAERALARAHIVYLPLEAWAPGLNALLGLRAVLGLRSCVNTVCRMLNPAGAGASVQGVFHPSYRLLQADAAARLGWRALTVIKGGGGEFERNPAKPLQAFGLRAGVPWEDTRPPAASHAAADAPRDPAALAAVARGAAADPVAGAVIDSTTALAFETLRGTNPAARPARPVPAGASP